MHELQKLKLDCLSVQSWRTWRLETLLRELGLKSIRARTQMLVETSAHRRCGKQAGVHGWISENRPLAFMLGRHFKVMQTRGSTTVEGKNLAPLSCQALLTRSAPPSHPLVLTLGGLVLPSCVDLFFHLHWFTNSMLKPGGRGGWHDNCLAMCYV